MRPIADEMFVAAARLALRQHLTTYAGYVSPDVEAMLREVAECLALNDPEMSKVLAKRGKKK